MEFFINNFKIRIDFSFIFILCLSLIFGYKNTGLLILFCFLHESAHLFALKAVGGKPQCLTVSFFGIALKYESDLSIGSELAVILAGPLLNIILYVFIQDDINLFLAVLNLLPVYPLDGGRVVKLLFPRAVKYVSLLFLTALLAVSVYILFRYSIFSLFLVCLYLILFIMRSL